MRTMVRRYLAITAATLLLLSSQLAVAEEWRLEEKPWEKFGANFGVFVSTVDSSFRIGSGIGVDIDVEDLLGLDSTNSVFRTDALWRFSKNRRHRLDFTWFAFRRDGSRHSFNVLTPKIWRRWYFPISSPVSRTLPATAKSPITRW